MWAILKDKETKISTIFVMNEIACDLKKNPTDTLFWILKVAYSRSLEYKPVSKVNTIVKVST